jgi:hypothetical protein
MDNPMPEYDIVIPELKNRIILTYQDIAKWIYKNIEYKKDINVHGIFEHWQTPEETIQLMSGDCEDKVILFQWLCYQYLDIKPIRLNIFHSKVSSFGKSHNIAVIEKNNYIFNQLKKYKKNGYVVLNKYTWEESIKLAHYYY